MIEMMKEIFDSYEDLAEYMVFRASEGQYTVAALFYEDAMGLMRELMLYDDVTFESIEISPPEYDGYEKEYYVSLADDFIAGVEKAYEDGRYLSTEADLTMIDADANSKILSALDTAKCRELDFDDTDFDSTDYDEYEDDNCDCEHCECVECEFHPNYKCDTEHEDAECERCADKHEDKTDGTGDEADVSITVDADSGESVTVKMDAGTFIEWLLGLL